MPLLQTQPLPTDPAGPEHSAARPRWSVRRWVWMSGLASVATFALGGVYGVPAATSSPDYTALASANMMAGRFLAFAAHIYVSGAIP